MKWIAAIALLAATSAFGQDKPAASQNDSVSRDAQSASGGVTAPRPPSFTRDAASSRALFNRLDKNRDGYLTGTELTGTEAQSANWLSIDRDGDGRISRTEFTAIPAPESASVGSTRRE